MSRIAYLASEYPAPSHTFIRREILALRQHGLTVLAFSVRPAKAGSEERVPAILESKQACVLNAARAALRWPVRAASTWALAQHHRVPGLRGWLWAQFHFIEALALARMLSSAGVDHLHSHFANSGATVGLLAAHFLQKPWSLTLHGISETDPPAGTLLPEKLRRARFVACASWFMQAQAMRLTAPNTWSKFKVVRCGVELQSVATQVNRRVNALEPLRFVTVGRLSPEKGQVGLLQAFKLLLSDGLDVHLTIVGDGPIRKTIEAEIRALGLSETVVLTGTLEEHQALGEIARGDIFVLPSLMEGLPVVLMEAMALARPVIAPAIAGIPELIRDGESGLLFKPGDWNQLKACMQCLANDPELCARIREQGRRRVEEEFEVGSAVEPLLALFGTSEKQIDSARP